MSNEPREDAPQPRRATAYYYCGLVILVVGLVSAGLIYAFAAEEGETEAVDEITSGRMYQHNLEVMGGKFAVYATQLTQWLASLWHGRALAYTVAVLAVAVAAACFWAAHLASTPSTDDAGQQRKR